MKIADDRRRQIAWRNDAIGLSIDQTRNRDADRSDFDVLLSQILDHRRELLDQLFRGHFAEPALDHRSFRIDQSGTRLSPGDVDADEMHSWTKNSRGVFRCQTGGPRSRIALFQ